MLPPSFTLYVLARQLGNPPKNVTPFYNIQGVPEKISLSDKGTWGHFFLDTLQKHICRITIFLISFSQLWFLVPSSTLNAFVVYNAFMVFVTSVYVLLSSIKSNFLFFDYHGNSLYIYDPKYNFHWIVQLFYLKPRYTVI